LFKQLSHWKGLLTGLTIAALVLTLIGCSSGNSANSAAPASSPAVSPSTSSSAPEPTDEKVSLTLWATQSGIMPGEQAGEWVEKDLVKEWNQLHPNISIKVELLPFDGINEKITTAIASKATPDLLFDYPGRTLAYAQMGALASLDDVIPPADLEKIKKNPDIMKMVSVNGEIVTMPYSSAITALILNKSLWKEKNAEHLLPQDEFRTWTPEQFKEALRAVADPANGVYGLTLFALNEQGDQIYNNVITAFGSRLFSDDYSKYTAADTPEAEQALSFFKSLVDEGLVNPHPETISAVNALDYWKQRKTGIIVGGTGHIGIIESGLKDGTVLGPNEYMFVNFPSPIQGQSALKMETGAGVVFKSNDPVKEQWAKKFLYWAQTESSTYPTAVKVFNSFGATPEWTQSDPELEFLAKLTTKASDWRVVDPGYGIKGFPEMRAVMFPEIQKLFINGATPKETIDSISTQFNEIIKKYQ